MASILRSWTFPNTVLTSIVKFILQHVHFAVHIHIVNVVHVHACKYGYMHIFACTVHRPYFKCVQNLRKIRTTSPQGGHVAWLSSNSKISRRIPSHIGNSFQVWLKGLGGILKKLIRGGKTSWQSAYKQPNQIAIWSWSFVLIYWVILDC
jgi:hypothetical protein